MGVDFYPCSKCGETYCDCGYYVTCKCGRDWCSDECAEQDGYKECYCKLGKELDIHEGYCYDGCSKYGDDSDSCSSVGCEEFVYTSCKHCRHEDYEDGVLLCKAMDLLNCDGQYLIDKIKDNLNRR